MVKRYLALSEQDCAAATRQESNGQLLIKQKLKVYLPVIQKQINFIDPLLAVVTFWRDGTAPGRRELWPASGGASC